jgi:putative component of membrane protein insertase Oxa1/YidC/SpoIIIJ protein YidD
MSILNWLAVCTIRIYQVTVSRYLAWRGLCCRYHPSCSQYGILAYGKYGFVKATRLTWRRFQDCRPGSDRPTIDFP